MWNVGKGLPRTGLRLLSLAGFSLLLPAAPLLATKPCPPPPCEVQGGKVDQTKCQELADWAATGTITDVVHHEVKKNYMKDFAEFTFTVDKVEKGSVKPGQKIRFQVGWCQNARELPKDTSGTWRMFGMNLPKDPNDGNEFLDYAKVETKGK